MHPEIIVTGYPNSGTSFLTELIAMAGFSPGPNLKGPDSHNPYGYWEYLPLRNIEWADGYFDERRIPTAPRPQNSARAARIAEIAHDAGVEVYKAVTLPYTYPWFGAGRAVLIRRSIDVLYERYHGPAGWTRQELACTHSAYHDLAAKYLDAEWDVLWIEYDGFFDEPEASTRAVCEFIGRPYHPRLLSIFRPRKKNT